MWPTVEACDQCPIVSTSFSAHIFCRGSGTAGGDLENPHSAHSSSSIPGGSTAILQRKTLIGRKSFRDYFYPLLHFLLVQVWRQLKLLTSSIWTGLQGKDSPALRSNLRFLNENLCFLNESLYFLTERLCFLKYNFFLFHE